MRIRQLICMMVMLIGLAVVGTGCTPPAEPTPPAPTPPGSTDSNTTN